MPEWLDGWPFLPVYLVFVGGAAVRSQATYWAGRGIAVGVLRTRWARGLDHPEVRRATAAIERRGMPVIPLSFLTVGFQSAVHAAAGVLRLPWLRYTLWAVPGYLLWALVWAGGGMTAVAGTVALAARSPWAVVAVVAVAAAVVARRVRARRRVAAVAGAAPGAEGDAVVDPAADPGAADHDTADRDTPDGAADPDTADDGLALGLHERREPHDREARGTR